MTPDASAQATTGPNPGLQSPPPVQLFGQYLIEQRVLTADELAHALKLMSALNATLGDLAVEQGLVSQAEADRVASLQREIDGRWGDIAVTLGVGSLERDDVEALRFEQTARNLRLSDAIVELGYTSPTTIDTLLERFEEERGTVVPVTTLPDYYQAVAAIGHVLDALPRLALRVLRTPVRIAAAQPWPGPRHLFAQATVSLLGPSAVAVGLSVDEGLADAIAKNLAPDGDPVAGEAYLTSVGEFTSLLAGHAARRLDSEAGRGPNPTRVGAPMLTKLPEHGFAFQVATGHGAALIVLEVAAPFGRK